jgi:membrane protein DedA with SNARE-associated domain
MSHHEQSKPLEPEKDMTIADKADEEQTVEPKAEVKPKSQLKYILLLVAAVLAVILVTVLVQKPTNFDEYIKSSGYIGVFLMALIGSASPIWPLPGSWAVFIAAGLGLNPIILGLLGGLGEAIGELTGYTAGFGGQVALQRFKRYKQIEGWMIRWGGPTIFVVSAIPNVFIKAATIAAGGLRYPIWKFFLFCWAGKTVKSLAFAFAGYGLFDGIKHLIDRIF